MKHKLVPSKTIDVKAGCGTLHVTFMEIDKQLVKITCTLGKMGTCARSFLDPVSSLISVCLSRGVGNKEIIDCINNHHCPKPVVTNGKTITSCADALAEALKEYERGRI